MCQAMVDYEKEKTVREMVLRRVESAFPGSCKVGSRAYPQPALRSHSITMHLYLCAAASAMLREQIE